MNPLLWLVPVPLLKKDSCAAQRCSCVADIQIRSQDPVRWVNIAQFCCSPCTASLHFEKCTLFFFQWCISIPINPLLIFWPTFDTQYKILFTEYLHLYMCDVLYSHDDCCTSINILRCTIHAFFHTECYTWVLNTLMLLLLKQTLIITGRFFFLVQDAEIQHVPWSVSSCKQERSSFKVLNPF